MSFADYSLLQILVGSIFVFSGAIEIGRWYGCLFSCQVRSNLTVAEKAYKSRPAEGFAAFLVNKDTIYDSLVANFTTLYLESLQAFGA